MHASVEGANAIAGWIVLLVCALINVRLIIRLIRGRKTQKWSETIGTIVLSDVIMERSRTMKGGHTTSYTPKIKYEYEVAGHKYISSRITYFDTQISYDSQHSARRNADRYPMGEAITVYYNPRDPREAVLQKGARPVDLAVAGVFTLVTIVLSVVWIL